MSAREASGKTDSTVTPSPCAGVSCFLCYLSRYKLLSERVAAGHRDIYSRSEFPHNHNFCKEWTAPEGLCCLSIRHFLFGFMEGNDYINGIVMRYVSVTHQN